MNKTTIILIAYIHACSPQKVTEILFYDEISCFCSSATTPVCPKGLAASLGQQKPKTAYTQQTQQFASLFLTWGGP